MVIRLGSGSGRWNASFDVMANSCPESAAPRAAAGGDQDLVGRDGLAATSMVWRSIRRPRPMWSLHAAALEQRM
jgi:hypothetical protein